MGLRRGVCLDGGFEGGGGLVVLVVRGLGAI